MKLLPANFRYRLAIPGETFECSKFMATVSKHNFPATDLGNGLVVNVSLLSLPRMPTVPKLRCQKCELPELEKQLKSNEQAGQSSTSVNQDSGALFDDRMHTLCTLKGKHRCEDLDDFESATKKECKFAKLKRLCNTSNGVVNSNEPSTSRQLPKLQVDIAKANLFRQKFLKNPISGAEVKLEKRNSSPNAEQLLKAPKLDLNEVNDALKALNCPGGSSSTDHQYRNDLSRQLRRHAQSQEQNNDSVTLILRNCRLQCEDNVQNFSNNNFNNNNSNSSNNNSPTGGSSINANNGRNGAGLKSCAHQKLESATSGLVGISSGGGCDNNQAILTTKGWSLMPSLSSNSPTSAGDNKRECSASDSSKCDNNPCERSDIIYSRSSCNISSSTSTNKEKINIYLDNNCDNSVRNIHHNNQQQTKPFYRKMKDISNIPPATPIALNNNNNNNNKNNRNNNNLASATYVGKARQRITFDDYPDANPKRCASINIIHDNNSNNNTNSNNSNDEHQDGISNDVSILSDELSVDELDDRATKNDRPPSGSPPNIDIPTPMEQAKFRKSLDSAASMVFHSRTGLPLTSSPAPVRRGKRFDFDSSINSVSAIKR